MQGPNSMPKQGKKERKKKTAKNNQVAAADSDVHMQESRFQRRRRKEKGMERIKWFLDEVTMDECVTSIVPIHAYMPCIMNG